MEQFDDSLPTIVLGDSSDTTLFSSAKLKVNRANKHIAELDAMLTPLLAADFYDIAARKDVDSDNYVLEITPKTSVYNEIALIVGDAVHNLRSALDHVMVELYSRCGISTKGNVNFPFSDSRDKLAESIDKGKMKALGADFAALFLDVIKPYKGGNDPLLALTRLDNIDKHKLLLSILPLAELRDVQYPPHFHDAIDLTISSVILGKSVIMLAVAHPVFKRTNNEKPRLIIAFGAEQPFPNEPIILTLQKLSQIVSKVIEDIESTCVTGDRSKHPRPENEQFIPMLNLQSPIVSDFLEFVQQYRAQLSRRK